MSFRGSSGTANGGAVQFVQVGATGVNFAANVPEEYSQSNPPIITPIQRAGLASSPINANEPAIVAIPWTAGFSASNAQGGTFPDRKTLATTPQVGPIWGTAFQGSTNSLYAAATYKRHSGLGPGGLAQIYRIAGVLGTDGNITTGTPTVTQWLNVQGKPIVGGGTVNVGTAATDAARGITTPAAPARDLDAYQKAGEIGIGAMAISADQKTLYFVNLFDRNLYSIDISDPVAAATTPIINKINLGLVAGQRPWAVEINRGFIYVGYVDSGEALATPTSASAAGLAAHVIRASEATPTVWSADLLNASLGYAKGSPVGAGSPSSTTNANRWNTWTDAWSWGGGATQTVEITWYGTPAHVFPQPILSNLEFDSDGYLTLGFLDRASIQGGNRNHSTVSGDTDTYQSLASGDILIASQSGGTFTIENNGSVGTRGPSTNAGNSQGPGGGEFYNDRHAIGTGGIHNEFSLGGLTGMGGVSEIVSTSYDPLDQVRVAGINWLNSTTGAVTRGYNQTPDAGGSANPDGTFQKGGGLGDIQALSNSAPLQIGNRVWFDGDQDGLQDADEPTISGVTVNLLQGTTVIATRTTGSNGEYYFSSTDSDLTGEFVPNGGNYTVQFVKPTTGSVNIGSDTRFGTVAWADVVFTTPDVGPKRSIDSNAIVNVSDTTKGEFVYTAGSHGVNNDTIDAGFKANGTLRVVKAIDPAGGAAPIGATYPITVSAIDFRGDPLSLGADASFALAVGVANARDISLPVGSFPTVSESSDPTVSSFVVSPNTPVKITGTGAARSVVTVTNTLYRPGTFSVSKTVSGTGASAVGASAPFTVEYTYPALGGVWLSMVVLRDGSAVTSDPIPYNTTVTIREVAPTTPASVSWGTPSWTVNSTTTTALTQTVVIGDNTNVSVGLDNPATQLFGSFSIDKALTGSGAFLVPGTKLFTVNYSVDGGPSVPVQVSVDGAPVVVSGLPFGAVVTFTEDTPTAVAGATFNGVTFSPVTVTIGNGTTVAVIATNDYTQQFGSFSIDKALSGSGASLVPGTKLFTVNYSVDGGPSIPVQVSFDGAPVVVSGLPFGAVVTFTEDTPICCCWCDVQWGDVLPDHGDDR